jgi:hypothetical protein
MDYACSRGEQSINHVRVVLSTQAEKLYNRVHTKIISGMIARVLQMVLLPLLKRRRGWAKAGDMPF